MQKAASYKAFNKEGKAFLTLNPFVLFSKVKRFGSFHSSRIHVLLLYVLKITFGSLFAFWEYLFYSPAINSSKVNDEPVFIIGFFRSGTTLMHKYLSNDPQFGYVRNSDLLLPYFFPAFRDFIIRLIDRILQFFSATSFAYNNVPFRLSDTQEEEMAMTCMVSNTSSYWAFVFPQSAEEIFNQTIFTRDPEKTEAWKEEYLYFLKKISLINVKKRLVLKNPANTGRIRMLKELFPKAKFIFIYRNPRDTFYSMKRLWKISSASFSLQRIHNEKLDQMIFDHYTNLHDKYLEEKGILDTSQLVEVRYEDFTSDPVATMERIYKKLEIGEFSKVKDAMTDIANREKKYSPFIYKKDPIVDENISKYLRKYFKMWQYGS